MTRTLSRILLAALALCCLIAFSALAQSNAKKKSYTLHGTIQAVKDSEKKVTVKHDKIEGYMGAMTMDYGVPDAAMLKKLKAGDEIAATIYEDEYNLYDIRVVQIDDRNALPK
jgi:Cu/Ag efflux protein CusF